MQPKSYWDTKRGPLPFGYRMRLVCISVVGCCIMKNPAPKNAPGKSCVRDGHFGSYPFLILCRSQALSMLGASVDWRLDCLRVSQRRAAECPPCSEEWLQLMACRNLKPVKFFIHQESSRLFTLRVVTFPSIPSQFCGAKILSKTDGEVRSCRRIPPILITMPTWLHGCVRQACHRGYEVALPKKVLLK